MASYMANRDEEETLAEFLDNKVFMGTEEIKEVPAPQDVSGFESFFEKYISGFPIERAAIDFLK